MSAKRLQKDEGYSLVELLAVMIIVAIMAAVAMKSLHGVNQTARYERTRQEMDRIARAIAGDQDLNGAGSRVDFGYIGDVGALPPNLDALVSNPGLGTWNGPYIDDEYYRATGASAVDFKTDEWGRAYGYASITITSTGGDQPITRRVASSADKLLRNPVRITVLDRDGTPPGTTWRDSVTLILTHPNGAGGMATRTVQPDPDGLVTIDSIPIGRHAMRLIYLPESDTLGRYATVDVGRGYVSEWRYHREVWADAGPGGGYGGGSTGGLKYVAASAEAFGPDCDEVRFDIYNSSGSAITVDSLTLNWSNPTGYYKRIRWGSTQVFNSQNPRSGTGDASVFTPSRTIASGDTVTVTISLFCQDQTGNCSAEVEMGLVSFQAEFSDGSILNFAAGVCP